MGERFQIGFTYERIIRIIDKNYRIKSKQKSTEIQANEKEQNDMEIKYI